MSLEVASEASGREGARHGNYFLSFWTVSTDDIALPDADRYIFRVSPGRGLAIGRSCYKTSFICCRALSASSIHLNQIYLIQPFRLWKSGRVFSADLAMNLPSVINLTLIS